MNTITAHYNAPLQEKKQQVMAARQASKAHNQQVRCQLLRSWPSRFLNSPFAVVVNGTANP
jgi:hypothetical protein